MKLSSVLTPEVLKRISIRWIAIMVVTSFGLGWFYNHYDYWRDPKFQGSLIAFGGPFDVLINWLFPDKRVQALQAELAALKKKYGES